MNLKIINGENVWRCLSVKLIRLNFKEGDMKEQKDFKTAEEILREIEEYEYSPETINEDISNILARERNDERR